MADKRISQLVDRGTVVNNDVIPIVVSGATTTNKATISSIQTFMQGNLDVGVTSVGITLGSTGTDVNVSGSPVTSSGNITINIPSASATNRGLVTTGSQTFAGAKTFNSDLIVNGITVGKGGASNGNNTAIGANSLSSNTTGTLNTATGISSLQYNTGGNSNTANGANSLVANTTGGFNTASGNQSLYSNTTGQANTAIGLNSLYSNTTGTYNIGVGSGAGYYIADGSTPNTTSDFSIYLGADTKASIDGAQNEVVIGYNAIGNGSNTVTIGNSSNTENYFTGNVRGLSFQVAAAGTANPIIIRNTSGTSSTTSNTNVIGFNSVNNIFVTTHSRGGFILGFNNSVSNREYTLPDASGTVALTSNLSAYLPLAGGTLTGALNGTSASFSGLITYSGTSQILNAASGTTGYLYQYLQNTGGSAYFGLERSTGGGLFTNSSAYSTVLGSANATSLHLATNGTSRLSIDSTGAATFSSSVTATSETTASSLIQQWSYNSQPTAYRLRLNTIVSSGLVKYSFDTTNGNTEYSNNLVLTNGNVGIGTASPSSKLTVLKTITTNVGATGNAALSLGTAGSSGEYNLINFGYDAGTWQPAYLGYLATSGAGSSNGALVFGTRDLTTDSQPTERMRITSGGYVKASTNGSTAISLTGTYHEFVQNSVGSANTYFYSTGATQTGSNIIPVSDRSNSSSFTFLTALSSGGGDTEFILRGDGNAFADGTWTGGGADYAEYFEWVDGNIENEDRRGYSVSLINDKIKIAEEGDTIIGVISGNASVIGDSAWNMWNEKYLRDDFQTYIRDENGDRILNPNYDPDSEYIPREKRPEWGVVGLVGKLCIIKGQPTMPNWIKLKKISDDVEQWLIK